ncbi:MAG: hypothetical protein PHI97_15175 [Desulfobulbus sp.]|nr:hypothetical protein [Desulfobulbus sp.]
MARTEQLDQHQLQQQRLALLALLAHRPIPTEQCLTDEVLAALVEGNLEQDEVEQSLAHLAECEQCMHLWLQLDRYWQSQKQARASNNVHRFLSRPKVRTAAGSLLAIAASIAVFVTITTRTDQGLLIHKPLDQDQIMEATPPKSNRKESTAPMPASTPAIARDQSPNREETTPESGSSALVTPKKNLFSKKLEPNDVKKRGITTGNRGEEPFSANSMTDSPLQERDTAAPPAATPPRPQSPARVALRAPTQPPVAKAGAAPQNLETWKASLRQGCEQSATQKIPVHLVEQGRHLLIAGALDGPQQALVRSILHQLVRDDAPARQCRRILELLGPKTAQDSR